MASFPMARPNFHSQVSGREVSVSKDSTMRVGSMLEDMGGTSDVVNHLCTLPEGCGMVIEHFRRGGPGGGPEGGSWTTPLLALL